MAERVEPTRPFPASTPPELLAFVKALARDLARKDAERVRAVVRSPDDL
jgi:hypothetical protein